MYVGGSTQRGGLGLSYASASPGGLFPPLTYVGSSYQLQLLWGSFHDQLDAGSLFNRVQMSIGDPYFFWGAVARGMVPDTYEGFETFAAVAGSGKATELNPDQRAALTQYLQDYLTAMPIVQALVDEMQRAAGGVTGLLVKSGNFPAKQLMADALAGKTMPLPVAPSLLDATTAVWNGVTKMWVPKSEVLASGERADGAMFLTTAAGTWAWAGPRYVEPAGPVQWTGKVAIRYVLEDTPGPPFPAVAFKQDNFMSDGTWVRDTWGGRAEWTTPEKIMATYNAPGETIQKYGSTVDIRFWSQVSESERAQILAEAKAKVAGIPMGTEPIPMPPPGSVVHVPAPGTGGTTTIKLPGSEVFVPVASVPQAVWDAVPKGLPPVTADVPMVQLPNGTWIAAGAVPNANGQGYTMPQPNGGVQIISNDPVTGEVIDVTPPQQAGFGMLGILLVGGAAIGLLMKKKGRR